MVVVLLTMIPFRNLKAHWQKAKAAGNNSLKKNYAIILKADSYVLMQTQVNEHIQKGYTLYGNLVVADTGSGICFFQPMIK